MNAIVLNWIDNRATKLGTIVCWIYAEVYSLAESAGSAPNMSVKRKQRTKIVY